jgi:hypothetical protein
MRRVIGVALALACAASAAAEPPQASQTTSKKTKTVRKASPTVSAVDVQALKDALAAQQQQIQQLQQQMQQRESAFQQAQQQYQQQLQQAQAAAADAQSKAVAAESAANEQKSSVDKLTSDMADVKTTFTNNAVATQDEQKRMSAFESALGRFNFSGDIRVRYENFFQTYGGCAACVDRHRERIRARFNIAGKLGEDFTGGISIASGSLGDPTSTNETLTNFFDRKTIALDRSYITYHPKAHKWLSLTGGKFAYTWQRTSVTFDPDLNPEGFSEGLSFDLKNAGILKNVSVVALQMFFNENNSLAFLTAHDSFAAGGQLSGKIAAGRLSSTVSVTALNFRNPEAIFNAPGFAVQATATPPGSTTPVSGFPGEGPGCANGASQTAVSSTVNCTFAPNGMTNATFIGGDGRVHFVSNFLYGDLILNSQIKTGLAKFPINLLLEAEQNLRAAGHPLDNTGAVRTDFGRQSHAYLIDASIGQQKDKGDVQIGYAFVRQEQDSVISSWNESDQRAPTNIVNHRVYALYKLRPNTVLSYTLWVGRTLNPTLQHAALAPGFNTTIAPTEPWLKRMQFDLIYSF